MYLLVFFGINESRTLGHILRLFVEIITCLNLNVAWPSLCQYRLHRLWLPEQSPRDQVARPWNWTSSSGNESGLALDVLSGKSFWTLAVILSTNSRSVPVALYSLSLTQLL